MRRQLAVIALVTGAGQVAALIKMWLVARLFGVGTELDGYNLAFVLPSLLSSVISGVIQTGLFPVHAQLRAQQRAADVVTLERMLFWCLLAVGTAISLLMFALSGPLGRVISQGAPGATIDAAIFVLRFAAFAVLFNAIGDYIGFLLALRERFIWAAAAPIVNALIGAALLAAWPQGGLTNLALGTLLGLFAQVAIVVAVSMSIGFFPLGAVPAWRKIRGEVREIVSLSAWMLPSVFFGSLTMTLPALLIAPFGVGAVSAFGYAFRFHQNALQLLIMAASPVILAKFSDLVARKEWQALDRLQRQGLWLSILVGVSAVLVVGSSGEMILRFAFGYGRFDASAASRVAEHWFLLSCGFGIALYGNMLAKRIQAARGARTLGALAMVGTLSLVLSAALLKQFLGETSVPIAVAVATTAPTLLMAMLLRMGTHGSPQRAGRK